MIFVTTPHHTTRKIEKREEERMKERKEERD